FAGGKNISPNRGMVSINKTGSGRSRPESSSRSPVLAIVPQRYRSADFGDWNRLGLYGRVLWDWCEHFIDRSFSLLAGCRLSNGPENPDRTGFAGQRIRVELSVHS